MRISVNSYVGAVAMRSKAALRMLATLTDKGLIEFDPLEGFAYLTDEGKKAIGS